MSVWAKESKTGWGPDQDASTTLQRTATTKLLTCVILWEFRTLSLNQHPPTQSSQITTFFLPPSPPHPLFLHKNFSRNRCPGPSDLHRLYQSLSKMNKVDGTKPLNYIADQNRCCGLKTYLGAQWAEGRSKEQAQTYNQRIFRKGSQTVEKTHRSINGVGWCTHLHAEEWR